MGWRMTIKGMTILAVRRGKAWGADCSLGQIRARVAVPKAPRGIARWVKGARNPWKNGMHNKTLQLTP